MRHSGAVSIYYWSGGHVALQIKAMDCVWNTAGKYTPAIDSSGKLIKLKLFGGLAADLSKHKGWLTKKASLFFRQCNPRIVHDYRAACDGLLRKDQHALLENLQSLVTCFDGPLGGDEAAF